MHLNKLRFSITYHRLLKVETPFFDVKIHKSWNLLLSVSRKILCLLSDVEKGFEISECKTRCSSDDLCRGYSIETITSVTESSTNSTDLCYLYTTSEASAICTFNLPKDQINSQTSVEPLNQNAECKGPKVTPPGVTIKYNEGCHIKIINAKVAVEDTGPQKKGINQSY